MKKKEEHKFVDDFITPENTIDDVKEKRTIRWIDIKSYFIGMYRYHLYYGIFKFLIMKYIREQIDYRIKVMDKECLEKGECKLCGCMTTGLQMANRSCDKPCYPTMMNRKAWAKFKDGEVIEDKANKIYWKKGLVKPIIYVNK